MCRCLFPGYDRSRVTREKTLESLVAPAFLFAAIGHVRPLDRAVQPARITGTGRSGCGWVSGLSCTGILRCGSGHFGGQVLLFAFSPFPCIVNEPYEKNAGATPMTPAFLIPGDWYCFISAVSCSSCWQGSSVRRPDLSF
jgi:hypothetical protein